MARRLAGLLLLVAATRAAAQEGPIALTTVNYAGLKEAVLAQRGKVVLVDLWAEY